MTTIDFITDKISAIAENTNLCPEYISKGSYGSVTKFSNMQSVKIVTSSQTSSSTITLSFPTYIMKVSETLDKGFVRFWLVNKKTNKEVLITDDNKKNKLKPGDYIKVVITNSLFGEAIISQFLSEIFTSGISPHFVIAFGYSTCSSNDLLYLEDLSIKNTEGEYISSLENFSKYTVYKELDITEELIDHLIISVLHSLFIVQYNYKMLHYDIYLRNIFIKDVVSTSGNDGLSKYFRGLDMSKIKYIEYKLKTSDNKEFSLYTKFYGFLIKLGDFSVSSIAVKDQIVIINDQTGAYNNNILSTYYPNYPFDYDKYFPDYFYFLREMVTEFGGISNALIYLIQNVPELKNKTFSAYSIYQTISSKDKFMNVNDILNLSCFNKYKVKNTNIKPEEILVVEYKVK